MDGLQITVHEEGLCVVCQIVSELANPGGSIRPWRVGQQPQPHPKTLNPVNRHSFLPCWAPASFSFPGSGSGVCVL